MTSEKWQQVKQICGAALELSPELRTAFLVEACYGETDVRREVEVLLASFDSQFLEQPAIDKALERIINRGLVVGQTISHYKVREKIGAGGMGEVYLAEDTKLHRPVALKILPENIASDKDRLLRFEQEAFAASALNHPNILTIFEFTKENGAHFLASEFVKGETLRERINRGDFTLSEILDITIQIASALQAAHEAGIIHRDIKPENVMIRADGYVKVLDFGLAKLIEKTLLDAEAETKMQVQTQAGMVMGTAAYMSPEQARGKQVDARTDIFSFGVVLYEMLTQRQPFTGETINHTIVAILEKEPPALSHFINNYLDEIERIVKKCLAKKPDERYDAAKDLLAELKEFKEELSFQSKLERSSQPNQEREKGGKGDWENVTKIQTSLHPPVSSSPHLNSVAVLPFSNMSADAENEYFCDGLAEELLNALAKIDELKVAARTSAFAFKGKNTNVGEIGNILNVKTILEGSVRKSGNRLRITVQLINASDGYHLWSERYDREMRDIFDVQDEITLAVVDALKVKLFGDEKAAVLKRYTDNPEAYELYLKGRYCFNKYAPEDLLKGIEYFEKAIEIEPQYAPAYAGIGFCYGALFYFGTVAPHEIVPKWKALITKALEIDDCLADAHLSLASIHFYYEWNSAEAERDYRRAIELNPHSPDAHWRYGHFLAARERFDEAIGEGEKAVELDPLSLVVRFFMIRIYGLANRVDDSLEQARKMIEIEPNFPTGYAAMGGVYMQKGLHEEAVEAYRKTLALSGFVSPTLSYLGAAYGIMGKRDEAYNLLNQLLEMRKSQYVAAFAIARVYAGLGENDKAFEWFEKAVEERNGEMVFLKGETMVSLFGGSVRQDPRFQDLIRRVGLPTDDGEKVQTEDETSEAQTVVFSPDKTEAPEATPVIVTKNQEPSPPDTPKAKRKWWLFGLLGLITLASGFFAYLYFTPNNKQIESIAVLPFVNESGNADVEYLSDGMTETLISGSSQIPKLNVKARSSEFRYKGKDTNAQTIGKELNVQAILTGRVILRGQDLISYVELVDAATENSLWKQTYNKTMMNIVALQNDIARDVADKLKVKLSGADERKLAKNYTENTEAYKLYLQGRFYASRRTIKDFQKSIEYFNQAIAVDPNYALAYAGLADSYTLLPGYFFVASAREMKPKGKDAALKALSLDNDLAEAHAALGQILASNDFDFAGAEHEYKRTIELNPNYATAHQYYGELLTNVGRHEESFAEFRRALEIDPLSLIINRMYGEALFFARRYDEGVAQIKKTLELDANFASAHRSLSNAYWAKGNYSESVEELAKYQELQDNHQMAASIREAFAKDGRKGFLQGATGDNGQTNMPSYLTAIYLAELGEKDEAFAELEKSYEKREAFQMYLKVDPRLDSLRDDPRFQVLLRKVGFPP